MENGETQKQKRRGMLVSPRVPKRPQLPHVTPAKAGVQSVRSRIRAGPGCAALTRATRSPLPAPTIPHSRLPIPVQFEAHGALRYAAALRFARLGSSCSLPALIW